VTYPRSRAPHDLRAAEIYDLFYNRMFLDPLVHGVWPPELLALLEQHQVTWDQRGGAGDYPRAHRR
jgi:beta-glucosidase